MDRVLIRLRNRELARAKELEWAAKVCADTEPHRAEMLRHDAAEHRANAEALQEALEDAGIVFVPPAQMALPLNKETH